MSATTNDHGRPTAQKWLPAIAQEDCIGCSRCVHACHSGSITLVWDFATLTRAEACDSCGLCETACPHDVIHMDWRTMAGDRGLGRWREKPEEAITPTPPRPKWLAKFLG